MGSAASVKSFTKRRDAEPLAALKSLARALLNSSLGLRDCKPATLDALVQAGQLRQLGRDELFLTRNAPFDQLGLLVEGSLEVSLTRHDGHRHLISFLQPGDLIGLMSLVDGLGHANDLRARQPSSVLLVPGATVRQLRLQDPLLGQGFERQLVFRSRILYERLGADPSMPLDARLARLLHLLVGLYGRPFEGAGMKLDIRISQTDLADWLGISRQRANFVTQQLKNDGLIALRYSQVTVLDVARLAARAQCGP